MKIVKVNYEYESRTDDTVTIVGLGDIHRGNPWMEEKLFYKTRDWIEENDCYVILMGDYGEAINAKDPRHDYNALHPEYMTPDKQYRKIKKDLEPIKDKCIMVLEGNHESNFWKRNNHNYTDELAYFLGVPYAGASGYVLFKFKRKTSNKRHATNILRIYAHHGWAGGRTDGYKVKIIQDLANVFEDAHLYLMGHTHKKGPVFPTTRLRVDARTEKIRDSDKHFVYTGSFIKGHEIGKGSYVEARAYPPTQLGAAFIEVRPNRVDGTVKNRNSFDIRYNDLKWMI